MPVCLAVDSFRLWWYRWVKEPRLRAIRATVRKRARAWLVVLGLVAFCLLCSPLRGAFSPWSVHAKDTCIVAGKGHLLNQKKKGVFYVLKVLESLLSVLAALTQCLFLFVSQKSRPVQSKTAECRRHRREGRDHGIVIIFLLREGSPTCATSQLEWSVLDGETVSENMR